MNETIQTQATPEQEPDPHDPKAFYAVLPDELDEPADYANEAAILQENDPDIEALLKELAGSVNYKNPPPKR